MNSKIIGIILCMLLIATVFPVSASAPQKAIASAENTRGSKGEYKSVMPIPSPDGNSYRVIMFCNNHQQTLDWISLINQTGFEKAWRTKFMDLTLFFMCPFTIILYGLLGFRCWYLTLFLQVRHKAEFQNFLQTYDRINGSGMITYLWLSGTTHRPVDFQAQPDNTWVNNSWILDNGAYVPNPHIWDTLAFWYFDFPPALS